MDLSENEVCQAVAAWLEQSGYADVRWVNAGIQGFDIQTGPSATSPGWIIEAKGAISSRGGEAPKPFGSGTIATAVAEAYYRASWWRDHPNREGRRVGFAIPTSQLFDLHSRRLDRACSELGIGVFRVKSDMTVEAFIPGAPGMAPTL